MQVSWSKPPLTTWATVADASAFGMGGVWFGRNHQLEPIVWHIQWPKDIMATVEIDSNTLLGTLTNSDLKMAGVLLHELVLESPLDP